MTKLNDTTYNTVANNTVFDAVLDAAAILAWRQNVKTVVDANSPEGQYAADSGSTDAYAITLSPVPSAYVTGMVVMFKANTTNTGAATLDVNGLGAKTIKKSVSSDLSDSDILSGQIVEVVYDGTNFQIQNSPSSNYGRLVAEILVSGSAVTSVSFTGLDGNAHGGYVLVMEIINATATNMNLTPQVNGDTTSANYSSQFITATGSTVTTGTINSICFVGGAIGRKSYVIVDIGLNNGIVTWLSRGFEESSNSLSYAGKYATSVTNLTRFDIVSTIANSLAVGSRFRLYRRM